MRHWWRADFHAYEDSVIQLEPHAGGRLYERSSSGAEGIWYTVIAIVPQQTLDLAGHLMPQFGGPATTLLRIKLEEEQGMTIVKISDSIFGRLGESVLNNVKEGWRGPGRRDGTIILPKPEDDALHIDVGAKNQFEWWYFDAHLEGGYTLVAFFYAAYPNPGLDQGKIAVELTLLRPDGTKTQKVIKYKKDQFYASREEPHVTIGQNTMKATFTDDGLPVYEIFLEDEDLMFQLTYKAQVKPWKPGTGYSHFADLGYFAWVIPFPRASVEGQVRDGDKTMDVKGVGYHDHNCQHQNP